MVPSYNIKCLNSYLIGFRPNLRQLGSICHFSSNSVKNDNYYDDMRLKVLDMSLNHVSSNGWTYDSIALGAKDAELIGVIDISPIDLVLHYLTKKNHNVKIHMNKGRDHNKGIERTFNYGLFQSISSHIDILSPYKQQWPAAVAVLLDPRHISSSMTILLDTVDDLCYFSDSNAVRFDWYSERIMVGIIYTATELFFLADDSNDHIDTK